MEYGKMEVFHFSRLHKVFDPSLLDLSALEGPILHSRDTWKYLGFIFNSNLSFYQHIDYYVNKAILTVKCIKILGNSVCSLIPHQKWLLYKSCVLSIALYSFQLWFYNKVLLAYLLKELKKMQRRVAIWIIGTFWTLSFFGIETIADLIPIYLYLHKLSSRAQLKAYFVRVENSGL